MSDGVSTPQAAAATTCRKCVVQQKIHVCDLSSCDVQCSIPMAVPEADEHSAGVATARCSLTPATQAKLQKAQQQREYAKSLHADVLRKLAAEDAAQQEAAAARARLVCLRNRLSELKALNTDRRSRAQELQAQVQVLKVGASAGQLLRVQPLHGRDDSEATL